MNRRWMQALRAGTALISVALASTACGGGGTSASTAATTSTVDPVPAATLVASGATFPQTFYEHAITTFNYRHPQVQVTYSGGGSGKGRADLQQALVDFAGTDSLVADADKAKFTGGEFLYFPTVAAPIAVTYNAEFEQLQLSPDTLALIFDGRITNWTDPHIVADNPGAKLPNIAITVVRRADASGTTDNFTKYLVSAAPSSWVRKSGSTIEWPAGTIAAQGSSGVVEAVQGTVGSIGYVDFGDARRGQLKTAAIKNSAGKYVPATLAGVEQALSNVAPNTDLTYNPINAPGERSYPITAPTWLIVYKNQPDKVKGAALKSYLQYLLTDGQKMAVAYGYSPLPGNITGPALAQLGQLTVAS